MEPLAVGVHLLDHRITVGATTRTKQVGRDGNSDGDNCHLRQEFSYPRLNILSFVGTSDWRGIRLRGTELVPMGTPTAVGNAGSL